MNQSPSSSRLIAILLILCFIAYCLPWVVNPGTSLSLGAYDLAEWTSLHPLVRSTNPTLLTTLLLRLPLACLGLIIAAGTIINRPILRLILIALISVALLPPLEFFTQATNDANYQQQFILAGIFGILGCALIVLNVRNVRVWIAITLTVVALVSSLIGVLQTQSLMQSFALPTQVGLGVMLFVVLLGGIAVVIAIPAIKQTR